MDSLHQVPLEIASESLSIGPLDSLLKFPFDDNQTMETLGFDRAIFANQFISFFSSQTRDDLVELDQEGAPTEQTGALGQLPAQR